MTGGPMSLLSWILMVFLLTAGSSWADVDEKWLTHTVEFIRTKYTEKAEFCAAVKIPLNLLSQEHPDLQNLLSEDSDENMQNDFKSHSFYDGTSVVAAKPHSGEHAEHHVLNSIGHWFNERANNLLLIYTYLSPCAKQCADPNHHKNILDLIGVMLSWGKHALVFQKPYSHPKTQDPVSEEELKTALIEIAKVIGYSNIFRCYKPESASFHCIRCFSGQNTVVHECIESPHQGGGAAGGAAGGATGGKGSHPAASSSSAKKVRVRRDSD